MLFIVIGWLFLLISSSMVVVIGPFAHSPDKPVSTGFWLLTFPIVCLIWASLVSVLFKEKFAERIGGHLRLILLIWCGASTWCFVTAGIVHFLFGEHPVTRLVFLVGAGILFLTVFVASGKLRAGPRPRTSLECRTHATIRLQMRSSSEQESEARTVNTLAGKWSPRRVACGLTVEGRNQSSFPASLM